MPASGFRPDAANSRTETADVAIRTAEKSNQDTRLERAREILGIDPPLTVSKALDATEGAGDPEEVAERLNEAKARLAQLNDSVEQARADLQDAREQLVEAEKANEGVEQAEEKFDDARRRLESREETFEERAEALRQAVEELEDEHARAMVRQRAEKAQELNDQIREKAEKMRDALEDLRSLNTEIADLSEEAYHTKLDGDYDVLRVLSHTGRATGLDVPPMFFEALDEGGERDHNIRALDDVADFLEKVEQA
jgi:chromosome segregation ATPase